MRRLLIALIATTATANAAGHAYRESCIAAIECGKYRRGSEEWQKDHDDWLNGGRDDLTSEDLDDVDGCAYSRSRDAGSHPEDYKTN